MRRIRADIGATVPAAHALGLRRRPREDADHALRLGIRHDADIAADEQETQLVGERRQPCGVGGVRLQRDFGVQRGADPAAARIGSSVFATCSRNASRRSMSATDNAASSGSGASRRTRR